MNNYELYHHGVLGMKWGIRRYQNKDGTLTPKGKKRYNRNVSSDYVRAHTGKKVSQMSDDELRTSIARLELEKKYSTLSSSRSQQVVRTIASIGTITTGVVTIAANTTKIKAMVQPMIDKVIKKAE